MFRLLLPLCAAALLTACGDGQPLGRYNGPDQPVTPPGDPENPTPAEQTQGSLADFVYNPGANTLQVQIASLDSTPELATYQRDALLDIGAYRAFRRQEDPLDRLFLGYARRVGDVVEGAIAMDGGQFSSYYGGVNVAQIGDYTPHTPSQPANGLVSYAGDYVGILNLDIPRGIATDRRLPVPPGTDPAVRPGQSIRIDGEAFLNADFTDNEVNGAIYDRRVADPGLTIGETRRLPDVFLVGARIEADGSFGGVARLDPETNVGAYSGVFGGIGATGVAGGLFLDGDFIDGIDGENEYGLFVLRQCGESGDDPICGEVNPDLRD